MPYKNIDIQNILPENEVHWKISHCSKRNVTTNEYRISIESEDKRRQYTCVSFEQLFELITKIPIERRCLYEHISCDDSVKFYLDYAYYKSDQNTIIDVNKSLFSIQQLFISHIKILSFNNNISVDHMVVLESSSDQKESYHIILDHKDIRFSNNYSIYLFVKEVFLFLLLVTLNHECLRKTNISNNELNNECSLTDLINIFNNIWLEWFACKECKIKNMELTVSDVCNLFVQDRNGLIVSCIDFKVYGIEQDFRMFMCTKTGEKRPLNKNIFFDKTYKSNDISGSILYKIVCDIIKRNNVNFDLVFNTDEDLTIDSMKHILQRPLIPEFTENINHNIDNNKISNWAKSIGLNVTNKREYYLMNNDSKKRKYLNQKEYKVLVNTEYEFCAEAWTKSYLKTIGSPEIIHSVRTGKHIKCIMCNIRNMNICKTLHDDYFNDSTIYINLDEEQFSVRCNRIPCNKNSWLWQPMF